MLRACEPLVVCAALVGGCVGGGDGPRPVIAAIEPARAYTDREIRLVMRGSGFLPAFRVDLADGLRTGDAAGFSGHVGDGGDAVALGGFGWRSLEELSATMNPGLTPGTHAVEVTDPRGHVARFSAFESRGADRDPPDVDFDSPPADAPIGPGVTVTVRVRASDPDPGALDSLHWEAKLGDAGFASGDCPLDAEGGEVTCTFEVTIPERARAGDRVEITAIATDRAAAANRTQSELGLHVRDRPSVAQVKPVQGGIAGGTDIVVKGAGFVAGTQALLDGRPLVPAGGLVVDDETISGRAPAHAAGRVALTVRGPLGEVTVPAAFTYAAPPEITGIEPSEAPADGGTPVRIVGRRFTAVTRVYFGVALSSAVAMEQSTLIGDGEIRGVAPAGTGRASVWALDPELGWSRLSDGFVWRAP